MAEVKLVRAAMAELAALAELVADSARLVGRQRELELLRGACSATPPVLFLPQARDTQFFWKQALRMEVCH